ncbi:MAG: sulfotransferase domain-containing protein [Cyanobium sp. LacPavin_0920_WC12_MAG_63_22]|nr:sulfotransferase domain-containing protein [Cyanobium sp. LacPavin_0920_WC12_MAG_63_22]
MSREALERGDWQGVIAGHQLESHDPAEWLRYGVALLQTIEPGPDAGKLQQVALAFVQAAKEGAPPEAVEAVQRQLLLLSLQQAMQLAGMNFSPEIAQLSELATAQAHIYILLTKKNWLHAVIEFEKVSNQLSACRSLRDQIRAAIFAAFCGTTTELAPADYAGVNQLRVSQDVPVIEQWQAGLEATAKLEKATPLVLINNFNSARRQLVNQPFWIAYGNVRTGSTMVFNLLRILANSLSSSAISAWEGDLVSPEKFFDLVDESPGISLGVLKIHRCHEAVNARLDSSQARAILSHRDMKAACFSYWRMLNNHRSPFFKSAPKLELLDNFLESEINELLLKSKQKNTLIVREADLRSATMEAINRIAEFVGVKPANESLLYLSDFLGANSLRQLAEANQEATNSTGHEEVTYLHPGHIAESSSEQQCLPEVRDYIEKLIHMNKTSLHQDGYCRLADPTE